MMEKDDLLYLDIETTGLEPGPAVILSVGVIHQDVEREWVIRPTEEEWNRASPEALKVNGMTWEHLLEFGAPLTDVRAQFTAFLLERKPKIIVGQNIKFDISFLQHFMGPQLAFVGAPQQAYNVIDAFTLLQRYDRSLPYRTRKNGHAISRALGVPEEDKIHTAIGGARAVYRNFNEIVRRLEQFNAVDKLRLMTFRWSV